MIARRALVVELPRVDCEIVRLQALTNLAYRYRDLGICPGRPAPCFTGGASTWSSGLNLRGVLLGNGYR
jgi:hypothetical protein